MKRKSDQGKPDADKSDQSQSHSAQIKRPGAADVTNPAAPPPQPFAVGEDEWEFELAAWDAAIPIVTRAPVVLTPKQSSASRPPSTGEGVDDTRGPVPDDENPFHETPTTVVSPAQLLDL
ncbi:MAG: hypothetical protein H7X95_11480, partial [Deltaproteobacteria bacterium]|nr:hypothetical protein [Deltaproteobacteria bacterium]